MRNFPTTRSPFDFPPSVTSSFHVDLHDPNAVQRVCDKLSALLKDNFQVSVVYSNVLDEKKNPLGTIALVYLTQTQHDPNYAK